LRVDRVTDAEFEDRHLVGNAEFGERVFQITEPEAGGHESDFGAPSWISAGVDDAVDAKAAGAFEQAAEPSRHSFFLDPRARGQQNGIFQVDPRGIELILVNRTDVGKMIGMALHRAATVRLVGGDDVADEQV
jgi:hypothetical protein